MLLSLSFHNSLQINATLVKALQVKPILIEFDKGDNRPPTPLVRPRLLINVEHAMQSHKLLAN